MRFLDQWNAMSAADAARAVLPCNGSRAWASSLAGRRPLGSLPELLAASDAAWWSVSPGDRDEAFASHPRLGEREISGTSTPASLQWSAAEQSTLEDEAASDVLVGEQLRQGNRAYEAKFRRVFLVRAAGRSSTEILNILQRRLENTPEAEVYEAAEQQREITHLRLQRWLSEKEQEPA